MHDKPLAAPGFTSYRCKNRFGWTMIGARDHVEALREACRTWEGSRLEDLEVWDGTRYVAAHP